MGFNKMYLPEIDELRRIIEDDELGFYNSTKNRDTFIGSEESIQLINQIFKKYDQRTNNINQ